jgi:hypothetical protein
VNIQRFTFQETEERMLKDEHRIRILTYEVINDREDSLLSNPSSFIILKFTAHFILRNILREVSFIWKFFLEPLAH